MIHFSKRTVTFVMVLGLLSSLVAPATVTPVFAATATISTGDSFVPSSTYLSPAKEAPIVFTALGIKWHQIKPEGTTAGMQVRFNSNNTWSQWFNVDNDIDGKLIEGQTTVDESNPDDLIFTNETQKFQYRVMLTTSDSNKTPVIENISFTYINAEQKVAAPNAEGLVASIGPVSRNAVATVAVAGSRDLTAKAGGAIAKTVKIISRGDWGADESLRVYTGDRPAPQLVKLEDNFEEKYSDELKITKKVTTNENGESLTWPLEYPEKVSKIIIHHTATTKDLEDPEKAIRNIYYWHAISKGWGDIGYNYIIDQQGNIYEGRYGGDGVVGAHAGKANVGSIGIAVLGNYQDNDPPDAVIKSLTALIKVKTQEYGIDPTGTSEFRGQDLLNIIGHRDVMSTSCPGQKLYDQIPAIRQSVKGAFKPVVTDRRRVASTATSTKKDLDFELSGTIPTATFSPGATGKLQITVKNTGAKEWSKYTYFAVSDDMNSRKLLNLDKIVKSGAIGKTIKPGTAATFSLNVEAGLSGSIGMVELFPMIGGNSKIEKYVGVPVQVDAPKYGYETTSLSFGKPYLKKGELSDATLKLKNTGNVVWKRYGTNKIMIGTEKPRDHKSPLLAKADARIASMTESEVKPGQTGTFKIKIKAPSLVGSYNESFAPVIEGVTWLAFHDVNHLDLYVYDAQYAAKFSGTGNIKALPGERKNVTIQLQNIGGVSWNKKGSDALNMNLSSTRPLVVKNSTVAESKTLPGQTANVSVSIEAPTKEGVYQFFMAPKLGTKGLMNDPVRFTVTVSKNARSEVASTTAKDSTGNITVSIGFTGNPIISADGIFSVYDSGKKLGDFRKDEKVAVTHDMNKYSIKGDKQAFVISNAPRFEPSDKTHLRIDNYEHRPEWKKEVNDNEYTGVFEVHWYDNKLVVVNDLPIEEYLKGLAEISADQPVEKIRSVIVLARTYALYYATLAEKFPGAPYNLSDDPEHSQKYLGYGFEKRSPTGVKAVNDTKGIVVTYKGKLIKTPYFSADDGRTRSAQEVWGWTDTPYLISVDDPGCKGKTMSGHGVGLSGCGSLYLANLGKTYTDIIKYYFQGVEVGALPKK